MKKIITSLCYVSLVMCLLFVSSCNDDNEEPGSEDKYVIIDFNGLLSENNSEYLSNEENGVLVYEDEYGYVYHSKFEDKKGIISFNNYSASWSGASYTLTEGFTYTNSSDLTSSISIASVTGKGVEGNSYLTGYIGSFYEDSNILTFTNNSSYKLKSVYITNTVYSYLIMKNGGYMVEPFNDKDWFKLIISGYYEDTKTSEVEVVLAEGSNLLDKWVLVDLTSLGEVTKLMFTLTANEENVDPVFGVNVPAYFCMDQLTVIVE